MLQWNHSNPDTMYGPEESVLIREVSLFQGLNSTQTWNLEKKKVSCLERCPGVLIEGFVCAPQVVQGAKRKVQTTVVEVCADNYAYVQCHVCISSK